MRAKQSIQILLFILSMQNFQLIQKPQLVQSFPLITILITR